MTEKGGAWKLCGPWGLMKGSSAAFRGPGRAVLRPAMMSVLVLLTARIIWQVDRFMTGCGVSLWKIIGFYYIFTMSGLGWIFFCRRVRDWKSSYFRLEYRSNFAHQNIPFCLFQAWIISLMAQNVEQVDHWSNVWWFRGFSSLNGKTMDQELPLTVACCHWCVTVCVNGWQKL